MAWLWVIGFFKLPSVPNTTRAKKQTDKKHGPFKTKHCIYSIECCADRLLFGDPLNFGVFFFKKDPVIGVSPYVHAFDVSFLKIFAKHLGRKRENAADLSWSEWPSIERGTKRFQPGWCNMQITNTIPYNLL